MSYNLIKSITAYMLITTCTAARIFAAANPPEPVYLPSNIEAQIAKNSLSPELSEWLQIRYKIITSKHLSIAQGHTGLINSLIINPHDKTFITASRDKTVKIWDINTGECLKTLTQPIIIDFLALTSDGTQLVTASSENSNATIWQLPEGTRLETLPETTNISAIKMSDNNKILIIGYADGITKIWDMAAKRFSQILQGHDEEITALDISPDGSKVVTGSSDQTVKIWETSTGKLLNNLITGHQCTIRFIAISADSKTVATYATAYTKEPFDPIIRIWNIDNGKPIATIDGIRKIFIDSKRTVLVTECTDDKIRTWDINNGTLIRSTDELLARDLILSISPDGKLAVLANNDQRSLTVWDTHANKAALQLDDACTIPASPIIAKITPDNSTLVVATAPKVGKDHPITIWPIKTPSLSTELDKLATLKQVHFLEMIHNLAEKNRSNKAYKGTPNFLRVDFTKQNHLREQYDSLPPLIKNLIKDYIKMDNK